MCRGKNEVDSTLQRDRVELDPLAGVDTAQERLLLLHAQRSQKGGI